MCLFYIVLRTDPSCLNRQICTVHDATSYHDHPGPYLTGVAVTTNAGYVTIKQERAFGDVIIKPGRILWTE